MDSTPDSPEDDHDPSITAINQRVPTRFLKRLERQATDIGVSRNGLINMILAKHLGEF